jgi:N-acetylglutamate synthase-like GNAT family acetyltransferase
MQEALHSLDSIFATGGDLQDLVNFLQKPEIDQAFVRPLSQRDVSINARVHTTFQKGFWLLAKYENFIVGCRGCKGIVDCEKGILEFTTTAIDPAFQRQGIGTLLFQRGIAAALERYAPRLLRIDSWSGNARLEKLVTKMGFVKSRTYDDPTKRPAGVLSVEYILDCSGLYIHRLAS